MLSPLRGDQGAGAEAWGGSDGRGGTGQGQGVYSFEYEDEAPEWVQGGRRGASVPLRNDVR
jgi:hypothetical protein